MPNIFSYIALIGWPLISLIFYKRMSAVMATFWTIIGGFLILPVKHAIDFPLIPPLDKESIPVIAALFGCLFIKKIRIKLLPKEGIERWLVITLLIIPFITMLNNQEVINSIPGLTFHDAISSAISQYLFLLPLILGVQLIKTNDDLLTIYKIIAVSALLYSLLILLEIRISPQLHTWIYGYFPHTSFGQQVRFGGFRAVVFLGHGLIVSMYIAIALGAITILMKQKIKIFGLPSGLIILYFLILLLLNKTVGGFILGALLFFVVAWMSDNMASRTSLLIIFLVLMYPLLLLFELFPHQFLTQLATDFDPGRGQSLAFRFYNENLLLEHAQKKLFFGWGPWGRNRLEGLVTDGHWIIIVGVFGLFGFLSLYGLAVASVWKAVKANSLLKNKSEQQLLIGHSIMVSVIMIDQLPNASLSAWMMFFIGALLGRVNNINFEYQRNKINFIKALEK
ncbi:MAG: hypothetical protein QM487_10465 [Candidatus Marithrix sp.]